MYSFLFQCILYDSWGVVCYYNFEYLDQFTCSMLTLRIRVDTGSGIRDWVDPAFAGSEDG